VPVKVLHSDIENKKKDVDDKLSDEQSVFIRKRSHIDQIAALLIIH
jgi:hypothetical protein